jgi:hypothetical protein
MARPPEIEVVRRAYELWEQSGIPVMTALEGDLRVDGRRGLGSKS